MSQPKVQADIAEDSYNEDLDKLWKILQNCSAESANKIVSQLDAHTLTQLRTRKNPYKTPVVSKGKNRVLAFNVINLREKYIQRFTMTSLIGFLYRMLDEWEPVSEKYAVSINDAEFANKLNPVIQRFRNGYPIALTAGHIKVLRESLGLVERESFYKLKKFVKHESVFEKILENAKKAVLNMTDEQKLTALNLETAKQVKHKIFLYRKKTDGLLISQTGKKAELEAVKTSLESARRNLKVVKRKLVLRTAFENTKEQEVFTSITREMEKVGGVYEAIYDYEIPVEKLILRDFDKNMQLAEWEKRFDNHQAVAFLSEERLKKCELALSNIFNQMEKNSAKISTIKSAFKKLNLDNVKVVMKEYELNDEQYQICVDEVKSVMGIKKTKEEYHQKRQDTVQSFLDEWFQYNPDIHVQSAYKPNYEDSTRVPLKTAWEEYQKGEITHAEYLKHVQDVDDELKKKQVLIEETHERSVIPPDDSFFRWQRYIDNNYEYLRQATDDIYAEKSDLEFSLVPLEVFEGTDEEIMLDASAWQRKLAGEFESDVFRAKFGQHNLLGSWEQNRERRDFYTKESEIIKRIVQQNEDDQKLGRRLMKQRIENKKSENKKSENEPGLEIYKEASGNKMENLAKTTNDMRYKSSIKNITEKDLSGVDNVKQSKSNEVEVGFFNIKPVGKSRRSKIAQKLGSIQSGKFHIPSENEMPDAKLLNANEFQKEAKL